MSDEHARENAGLRRDLKARHITMKIGRAHV